MSTTVLAGGFAFPAIIIANAIICSCIQLPTVTVDAKVSSMLLEDSGEWEFIRNAEVFQQSLLNVLNFPQ